MFNAATHFVDRNIAEGRGPSIAIECGDERVSYQQLADRVNRFGSALRARGIQPEQRVALILQDTPAFAYAFFGAIKIGAVPVPLNTLWRAKDYRHALGDSGARVLVISEALLREFVTIDRAVLPRLEHIVVVGQPPAVAQSFDTLLASGSTALEAEPTHRDAMAFWLYSSGSTGGPKACVHLQHDMFVCAERYAKRVLGMRDGDRCFSVAKLFFAYGLGNALYMPFAVGATSILMPDPPAAPRVYEMIERYRPTLFFSVPTNFGMLLAHQREGGGEFDLSSVRHAVSAGEALPESLFRRFKERFGVEILDAIGSTECLHMFIANRPGQVRPGSSGQLVPGYDARIVDDEDRPVAVGGDGQSADQGRLDLRVLLEPAREDQADDPGRVDSHRRQVPLRRRRLLLVRRPYRRHAEGWRHLGEPGGDRKRADRSRGGAGMRGNRPGRWGWVVEAICLRGAASAGER